MKDEKTELKWGDPQLCKINGEWKALWSLNTLIGEITIERPIEMMTRAEIKLHGIYMNDVYSYDEAVAWVEEYLMRVRESLNKLSLGNV